MKFLDFISKLSPSFSEWGFLDCRTWSKLRKAIQGELDARGPKKVLSDAFQLWKEIKPVIDKSDTVKLKVEMIRKKWLALEIKNKLEPKDILSSVSLCEEVDCLPPLCADVAPPPPSPISSAPNIIHHVQLLIAWRLFFLPSVSLHLFLMLLGSFLPPDKRIYPICIRIQVS